MIPMRNFGMNMTKRNKYMIKCTYPKCSHWGLTPFFFIANYRITNVNVMYFAKQFTNCKHHLNLYLDEVNHPIT